MTPATEPTIDNHFPVDFPWERQEEGGLFNIGPDAPEDQHWWKKGDHEADKSGNGPISVLIVFFVTILYYETDQDKVKLQDFVVLFTYTVQTFTFYLLLKCNLQTLAFLHIL